MHYQWFDGPNGMADRSMIDALKCGRFGYYKIYVSGYNIANYR